MKVIETCIIAIFDTNQNHNSILYNHSNSKQGSHVAILSRPITHMLYAFEILANTFQLGLTHQTFSECRTPSKKHTNRKVPKNFQARVTFTELYPAASFLVPPFPHFQPPMSFSTDKDVATLCAELAMMHTTSPDDAPLDTIPRYRMVEFYQKVFCLFIVMFNRCSITVEQTETNLRRQKLSW